LLGAALGLRPQGVAGSVASSGRIEDLYHAESEARSSVEGTTPAFSTDVVGTTGSSDAVLRSLRESLKAAGYQVDPIDSTGIPSTAEETAEAWRKGDVVARISILVKDDPRNPGHERASEFATIYQMSLFAKKPVSAPSG
jgi:hypothetical protein